MKKRIASCAVLGFLLCSAVTAPAQSVQDVVELDLVPGWRTETGSHMAGLRITLAPGWKTYWRVPGESGIPPTLTFAQSTNVHSVRIGWPRPGVFESYGLETIGYADEVVLPLEIKPTDASTKMNVSVRASIGVCRDICLPVEILFSSDIAPGAGAHEPLISDAIARIPKTVQSQTARCAVEPIRDGLQITAYLPVPAQGGTERVFLEPSRSDVWTSPSKVSREGDTITAVADLVPPEAKPFALNRSQMRFTVLGDKGAVEMFGCQAD